MHLCRNLSETTQNNILRFLRVWESSECHSDTCFISFREFRELPAQVNTLQLVERKLGNILVLPKTFFRVSLYFFRVSESSENSEILNIVSFLMVINGLRNFFPKCFPEFFYLPSLTVVASALGTLGKWDGVKKTCRKLSKMTFLGF